MRLARVILVFLCVFAASWPTSGSLIQNCSDLATCFNLGRQAFLAENWVEARGYFMKAQALSPWDDSEIEAALFAIHPRLGSPIDTPPGFYQQAVRYGRHPGLMSLLALSILGLGWIHLQDSRRLSKRKKSLSLIGLLLLTYGAIALAGPSAPTIHLTRETTLVRSGPGDRFIELIQLPKGSQVVLHSSPPGTTPDEWVSTLFESQKMGWIQRSQLLLF